MTFRPPEDRWEPWHVEVNMLSGPDRTYDSDHTEDEYRQPVGFTPEWTPDPHPWCDHCCCEPRDCTCPEYSVPANVVLGAE